MAMEPARSDVELIDSVCERVGERLPDAQAVAAAAFVRHFYRWVPAEDLADRSETDVYGAAIAQWNLALERKPGEAKLHVYNPDREQWGWYSPHSVLQIVSDDMPFLVDSVTMAMSDLGYGTHLVIHPVIRVHRDAGGTLTAIAEDHDGQPESVMHVEFDREPDAENLAAIKAEVEKVLSDVRSTVEDWSAMRGRAEELAAGLQTPAGVSAAETAETETFLRWLADANFTFIGYREYELGAPEPDGTATLTAVPGSGLGILRGPQAGGGTKLSGRSYALALDSHQLLLTKANAKATVHRPVNLDYVGIKRYAGDGTVTGECRFLGLYTTSAYKTSALKIPIIREKVAYVLEQAGFPPDSHDAKALTEICESFQRDSLFQITREDLLRIAIGILGLGERQRVRVFLRPDPLDRFVASIICLPRERFNTGNRTKIATILTEAADGSHYDWSVQLTESTITRLNIVVHTPHGIPEGLDEAALERTIAQATRAWSDDLRVALVQVHGEEAGVAEFKRFATAFPPGYRSDWPAHAAVDDIAWLQELDRRGEPIMRLYRPREAGEGTLRCKLYSARAVSLSSVLPTFEHLGAGVTDEHPHEITPANSETRWIYDFGIRCEVEDVESVQGLFEDAFLGVWRGDIEDNGLNALVLLARLDTRALMVVHAISKYLRQAGIPFGDRYVERTLVAHPAIVRLMADLFAQRLDPARVDPSEAEATAAALESAIDGVASLDEDRILRAFLSVIQAVLRTNHYALAPATGQHRGYLSFKLDPARVPILPLPRPKFEIFVYSPRVEGVHLRGGSVARGGLRWSDRNEDFRTEVLGLMKAQMVKNALIVPVGSKGGFVVKKPDNSSREAFLAEGIECYKIFLRGLLDVTDNIIDGNVVAPADVIRYDGDDPYLVVAADKGTATFSDIANGVSHDYGFWLGDAFASGGSVGYDHKAMGITAKGAWESVKRHFRELGHDTQTQDFTVVGIGDMAGDVFGNGMLLSEHIRLIAAFNHLHIFIDPNPDPAASFVERRRLFELPRSSWTDYDEQLISTGGGIFERTAKQIPLSPEAREALGIGATALSPTELIAAILRAPVDMLWNGGIGTYVKAEAETNADVGDKANDALRVSGAELRCRVVGEGGNLGFTQRGRIEYSRGGGMINTDAIDNVAGVNCSDHEVNIKILLGALVSGGELTEQQRNDLLTEMTDEVAAKVLAGSYSQTQALSLSVYQAVSMLDVHTRMIRRLEQDFGLNREVEYLPSEQQLTARRRNQEGLCSPELSVVMAYSKMNLYDELLASDLPDDPYLGHNLERYFPEPLPERYTAQMHGHRLRREIIATVVANQLVDRAGTTFTFRLREETGASPAQLARAHTVAVEVFSMREFWAAVESLDNKVAAATQMSMLVDGRRLVERAARWLVQAHPGGIDIPTLVARYGAGAQLLAGHVPGLLDDDGGELYAQRVSELTSADVPEQLAARCASLPALLATFDIVEVGAKTGHDPETVMLATFAVGARLQLNWLRNRINELPRSDRWQTLARAALRDDLAGLIAALTAEVIAAGGDHASSEEAFDAWERARTQAVERFVSVLSDIRASGTSDTTTLPVALREVRNLVGLG
ncbi:MAG TPA: NAD-glutamate dehydrogenase [Solirubrobacteraceae bacterium]|nr:NAD-glutamate dehydrogenase [Solirubrobacteraceae bacterium]